MTTDADLVVGIRAGETAAVEVLYARYVIPTRAVARSVEYDRDTVDDLVAESFTRVLESIHSGGGPGIDIGSYLASTVRHLAVDRRRRGWWLVHVDDVERYDRTVPWADLDRDGLLPESSVVDDSPLGMILAEFECTVALAALRRLAPSTQAVLLHIVVNGASADEAAAALGLSAESVRSRLYRARERLRQEYLSALLPLGAPVVCQQCVDKLGAFVRGGLGPRRQRSVEQHLHSCSQCRECEREVRAINSLLPGTPTNG